MKKITAILLSLIMTVTVAFQAGALATKEPCEEEKGTVIDKSKYSYYEDFSTTKVNQKPATFSYVSEAANTSIAVVKDKAEDGDTVNLLKIDDKNASGNAIFDIPVNQKKDKTLIETKFKFVKTSDDYMSFGFDLMNGNNTLGRVIQWSSGGTMNVFSSAGVNIPITIGAPENEAWYTLEILIDKESGTFDVQLASEALKNKTTTAAIKYDAKTGVTMLKGVSVYPESLGLETLKMRVQTTSKRGELYFEYFRVTDGAGTLEYKGAKPEPLKLPMGTAPTLTAIYNTINVNYKGEYLFFTYRPYEKNGEVYIPLVSISSAYGFKTTVENGVYTMSKDNTVVKVDSLSGSVSLNGKNIEAKASVKNKAVYLPVIAFATAMGDNAVYNGTEVVITEKE